MTKARAVRSGDGSLHFNIASKCQVNKRRENKRARGNKLEKTNFLTSITLTNKQY